jgi:hypothetical protein
MKKLDTCCSVYECVCQNPGIKTSKLSNKLKMPNKKIISAISDLKKMGLIELKTLKKNKDPERIVYPIKAVNLLPNEIRFGLTRMKF